MSVSCVVCSGLVVLAPSTLYGKVPRLILKKTNRLTQAVIFSRRHLLCGALLLFIGRAQRSIYIWVQRECSAEPFMAQHPVSHLSPVLAYDFLSRGKFRTLTSTPMYSSRLYAQNPMFEIVHEESVKVYLHIHVDGECSREPSTYTVRRIMCH